MTDVLHSVPAQVRRRDRTSPETHRRRQSLQIDHRCRDQVLARDGVFWQAVARVRPIANWPESMLAVSSFVLVAGQKSWPCDVSVWLELPTIERLFQPASLTDAQAASKRDEVLRKLAPQKSSRYSRGISPFSHGLNLELSTSLSNSRTE